MNDRTQVLKHLEEAMRYLYEARYTLAQEDGGKLDQQTFQEIAGLQDALQRLLSRLEKKEAST